MMDSNYEWQRFRANEWAQARRREAEGHRLVRGKGNGRFSASRLLMSKAKSAGFTLQGVFHDLGSRTAEREQLV